jgi:glycerophosphoryl diester phosphodiesterase
MDVTMGSVPAPLLIAHRLPGSARECTSLADAGAGGFELDIQLRGDAVVVSHYLPFLQISGWLEHDGARFRWGGGRILDPRLNDAAARVPGDAVVVLDPKEQRANRRHRLAGTVATTVTGGPIDLARYVVTTDDPRDLRTYRAAGIATWRTVGTEHALHDVLRAGPVADAGLAVRHTLLETGTIQKLRERAGTLAAWTVNDVARARALAARGVDAITTDSTAVLRALRAR